MKTLSLITLLLLVCFAIRAQTGRRFIDEKRATPIVVAKVSALPEVKLFFRIANKAELPEVLIYDTPTAENNWRYRIKLGYSSRDMFRSLLIFEVDAITYRICYEDFLDESTSEISLQQWRRWRHDPRFSHSHKFVHGNLVAIPE